MIIDVDTVTLHHWAVAGVSLAIGATIGIQWYQTRKAIRKLRDAVYGAIGSTNVALLNLQTEVKDLDLQLDASGFEKRLSRIEESGVYGMEMVAAEARQALIQSSEAKNTILPMILKKLKIKGEGGTVH